MRHIFLITNNPVFCEKISRDALDFRAGATSLDVLLSVRDAVHLGSLVLTHPLYGNLRPHQQPFRSVLLEKKSGSCDFESLTLVENAIDVYQSCADRLMRAEALDDETRRDYELIDYELLRESLVEYRMNNV